MVATAPQKNKTEREAPSRIAHLTISTTILRKAIATLKPIIPSGVSDAILPAYRLVRLEVSDGFNHKLSAFNGECAISYAFQAENSGGSFSVFLPGKLLEEVVSKLPKQDVELEVFRDGEHEKLRLRSGGLTHDLICANPESGLEIPEPNGYFTSLPAELMRRIALISKSTASEDANGRIYRGVLLKIEGGKAVLCGTDGKQMARSEMEVESPNLKLIIPPKLHSLAGKLLADLEGDSFFLSADESIVKVSGRNISVTDRLFDRSLGEYNDFSQVIPTDGFNYEVTLESSELDEALSQVYLPSSKTGRIYLVCDRAIARVAVDKSEVSGAWSEIPCYAPEKFTVCLEPNALRKGLTLCEGEITILMVDTKRPLVTSSTSDPNTKHVLMPINPPGGFGSISGVD